MTEVPAQNFTSPEVRVVEASAGSGKTFALAKRYVQLLLNPALSRPSNHLKEAGMPANFVLRTILAVTFTNKAAFEMKARILYFLKKIALESLSPAEETEILKPLGLGYADAAPRAAAIMEELIHHYNFFQVQTIDSFVNALLSGCAFKIGLSANFKIRTNAGEYLQYSLDRMIDLAASEPETRKIFEQFIRQYLFLENKTGWFPKQDILGLLSALYQQSNIYGQNFISGAYRADKLFKLKQDILAAMRKLQEQLPAAADGRFVKILDEFLAQNQQGFDIDRVSDFFNREELPLRKGGRVPAPVVHLWEKIRAQLKELSENEAASLFNPYIEMFCQVIKIFKAAAMKDDVLFLEQLNKEARSLFDEDAVTVEELYYRLATRFRHYLIDEFQDTSILQWQNLTLMVEEALSTGGTLFYVGDKKQAIYGFRGGEARLFEYIKKEFAAFNVRVEQLAKNYRSRQNIVAFNNRVFSMENLRKFIAAKEDYETTKKKKEAVIFADEDYDGLENVFGSSQQQARDDKPGGYVKVEYIGEKKKDTRDDLIRLKLIGLVRELRARHTLKDIAILTRDNKEVEQTTAWLLAEGIFVESERTLNIKENPLIRELIAFLQFLQSPIDNIAFAQFILGDIFSQASGRDKEEFHGFIFGLRNRVNAERDLYLYREFRACYPEIWQEYIDEFFRNIGLYPLYELMMSIVSRLKVLTNFSQQQGFVMRFLELIKKQEEETSDTASFLEHFEALENEDLYVNVSDTDAIRILTVHKAKGLEFPVVIIPFLGMDIHVGSGGGHVPAGAKGGQGGGKGGLGQQAFVLDFKENNLRLLRIKNKYLNFSEELKAVHHRVYVQSFICELNKIYVAMTRPQEELYIFVPDRTGSKFNFINFLVPEDVLELGCPPESQARVEKPLAPRERLPVSEYRDWIGYLKDEFLTTDEVANRERIQRGEILHFLLALVGDLTGAGAEFNVQAALDKARMRFPYVGEWQEYEVELAAVLKAPGLRQFFSPDDGQVFCEIDFVSRQGRTKRLDRLIVKPDEVRVVDYKSSRDAQLQAGYQEQVREYMAVVGDSYPGRHVRGFLIYLDEKVAEEIA